MASFVGLRKAIRRHDDEAWLDRNIQSRQSLFPQKPDHKYYRMWGQLSGPWFRFWRLKIHTSAAKSRSTAFIWRC